MSKRNLVLLIILLILVLGTFFGFLYFTRPSTGPDSTVPGTNFVANFNPFDTTKPATTNVNVTVDTSTPNTQTDGDIAPAKLKKVSSMPVAGFTVFAKQRLKDAVTINTDSTIKTIPPSTEFAPALRYVAKATGNIYQTFADKLSEGQFTTTIVPKIYEAYFGGSGDSVIMRYLKADDVTIETFLATLPKEILGVAVTTNNQIKGSFLPEGITEISISPDTSKVFYLSNVGDNVMGVVADMLGNKKTQVFSSPFTEWLSQWPNGKMITLTTKPSSSALGYMYSIDPGNSDNGNLTKILGGINGLTTLTSPNGKSVLYGDNNLSLYIYHTDTKSLDSIGVKTLPEKCVWGSVSDTIYCTVPKNIPSGLYPDSWYRGEVSFSDQIWGIDVKSGNTTMLIDPGLALGAEIDGIKLALDQDEKYLFLVNKKDSFLWELGLK